MLRVLLALWLVCSGWAAGDFSFDATTSANTDVVVIANIAPFRLPNAFSLVTWHRTIDVAATSQTLFTRMGAVGTHGYNWRQTITAADRGYADASSALVDLAGFTANPTLATMTDGLPHAIVTIFSVASGSATVYADLTSNATDNSVAAADDPSSHPIVLGAAQTNIGSYTAASDFRGQGEGFRVYSRKLDPTEVAALSHANYKASHISWSGLEGYWPMKGVIGTNMGTVVDYSNGNRSPGTAGGTTLPTYTGSILRGVH